MTPREARLAAGFTLAAAAEIIRVKPATYGDYERGHGRFNFRHAERLAKAWSCAGVSVSDFARLPQKQQNGDRNPKRIVTSIGGTRPARHTEKPATSSFSLDGAH